MQNDNKKRRQEVIIRLISGSNLTSQDALLGLIRGEGFECTQATLSRDLHELRVVRIPAGNRGYIYAMPPEEKNPARKVNTKAHLTDGFLGLHVSGNMLVINTLPGYASRIALAIDQAGIPAVLGTIAGDDTIMAVLKENVTKDQIITVLGKSIPVFRNKI
ncbi:MAG TPA: ArgR family transcriptional regulator [Prolixibacteraceae bacterium]|nr:ArgR family transcriptional regulator [Prolixibacteraceae bacterium]